MLCASLLNALRFSPILLIYRFALWKIEETDFTCVLAVTITTVDGNTCFAVHLTFYMNNLDLFVIQAVLRADYCIYNICNFGDIYIFPHVNLGYFT